MLRRLFFLFPAEARAQKLVDQLSLKGIKQSRMHAISHGVKLRTLPEASKRQQKDTVFRLERFLWTANLVLFVVAIIVLLSSLILNIFWLALISIIVMIASFAAGEQFVVRVPDVHLTEFTDALRHGEILLMIDVPASRVAEIEDFVHRRYPEAAVGGVGWSMDAFGI